MKNFFKKFTKKSTLGLFLAIFIFSALTANAQIIPQFWQKKANNQLYTTPNGLIINVGGCNGCAGATSLTSPLSSLTVSPTTGAIQADVNLAHNFDWTGQHTFNTHLPTSTQTPVAGNELVTKTYTDTFALGLQVRPSVMAATTAALQANTYANGALGVGATLTENANGAFPAIDGVSLPINSRLLVKNEVAQLKDGIYTLTNLGGVGTQWILTRAVDYDQTAEVTTGTFTSVTAGTVNTNTQWVMDNPNAITMGTTAITFSQLSSTLGNVVGTPPSVDNAIARYDGTTGLKIQNSDLTISDVSGGITTLGTTSSALHVKVSGNGNEYQVEFDPATAGSGAPINMNAQDGFGGGQGGMFSSGAGWGGATGLGGPYVTQAGNGGFTSGRGGHWQAYGGSASAGNSDGGDVWLTPGSKSGTGVIGKLRLYSFSGANFSANLDTSLVAASASDKTFTFQNLTGTLAELQNNLGAFAATTSAQLAAVLSDETGTGLAVFNNSPVLITPNLGTPSVLVGTNITGTAAGLTAGSVTTNANLTGPITSVGNATAVAAQTGIGSTFVMQNSPTLITPNLGTPSAAVLTNATGLPVATGISGLAAGIANFLATPTSANLATAVTNETGTGLLVFNTSPTFVTPIIGAATGTSLITTGAITTSSTGGAGVGYTTGVGAGGIVTQLTSKATAVTLNKATGRITMNAANLANNTSVTFTLNDTTITAADVVVLNIQGGGTIGAYQATVSSIGAGTSQFTLRNVSGGALAQAVVLQFAIIKGAIN